MPLKLSGTTIRPKLCRCILSNHQIIECPRTLSIGFLYSEEFVSNALNQIYRKCADTEISSFDCLLVFMKQFENLSIHLLCLIMEHANFNIMDALISAVFCFYGAWYQPWVPRHMGIQDISCTNTSRRNKQEIKIYLRNAFMYLYQTFCLGQDLGHLSHLGHHALKEDTGR